MLILDPLNAASYASPALAGAEAVIDNALSVAPVALAAAQAQKAALVEAIFNTLRQAPLAYTVGATAYTWDARDEAIGALTVALTSALIAGANTALAAIVNNLNASIAVYNAAVPDPISEIAAAAPVVASLPWTPIGATVPVTLGAADAAALIAAIATRRATLQSVRLTQQAAVAAATTVAQVIALSVSGAAW